MILIIRNLNLIRVQSRTYLLVSAHGKLVPTSTQLAIKYSKFVFLLPRKKENIVRKMKQNHTKHVYFSFFDPVKVTGKP